ncbi:MAG: COR domain-containing protein, partial [Bacteroidota bacterium]
MQGRFGNVKGSWATNILTCRGLEQVRAEIEHQVQQLPLVGQMLPKQWVEIRRELEALAKEKNHISEAEYLEVCAKNKIPEADRAKWLSSYLHDLGAFLHFQEDRILRDLFILKNAWATDAVYKVLDNENVKSRFGRFTFEDLDEIWKARIYRNKHLQLLALMQKFELCYELSDQKERTWLAPQLLQVQAPDYDWDDSNNLVLRYRYGFMPKGLLSRFFVRMNRYVATPEKAWRSGVFLEREKTEALVREAYGSQEIIVRVRGANPKELMTIISEEFDKMNDSYGEKLQVQKLMPCNCSTCEGLAEPHYYDYKNLRIRQERGKRTVECDRPPFEDVSVLGLLEGIFIEKERLQLTEQDLNTNDNTVLKTVELFLASSSELEKERREIEIWIGRENKRLVKKGVFLQLNIWEDFLDAMSKTRKQDDYNKAVLRSDIFISLFATKVGKYTKEEFQQAYGSFLKNGKPEFVFTYFKNAQINVSEMDVEALGNLQRFKNYLDTAGHFPNDFDTFKDLNAQLKEQLYKILEEKRWLL